jgi:hypothetical protein
MLYDAITERVLGAAMKVHTSLGAGCHLAQVLKYLKLSGHQV